MRLDLVHARFPLREWNHHHRGQWACATGFISLRLKAQDRLRGHALIAAPGHDDVDLQRLRAPELRVRHLLRVRARGLGRRTTARASCSNNGSGLSTRITTSAQPTRLAGLCEHVNVSGDRSDCLTIGSGSPDGDARPNPDPNDDGPCTAWFTTGRYANL